VEDELENAFQVLDFARQSILSQIDSSKDASEAVDKLQFKLIDVYDLIAQVHQEGGR
jgi:ArsR family metal-binding transcriptional regulator